MRTRRPRILAALLVGACSRKHPPPEARPIPVPSVAPAVAETPTPAPPPEATPPAASFTVHEWGLVATTVGGSRAVAGTGVIRPIAPVNTGMGFGLGTIGGYGYGGKPVLYVHLDPGVDRATFSLDVSLPAEAHFDEHWPPASLEGSHLRFADVVAARGACEVRTPPPSGGSPACRTEDHFCEAAEIPRYEADHDVCLTVGPSTTDLLFYRASGLDVSALPLTLSRVEVNLALETAAGDSPTGPVLYLEKHGREVSITRLQPSATTGRFESLAGESLTVEQTRAALIAEALARGLTADEADAFVDAWAPAYFDHCHRPGPEAHGHAPTALTQANRTLLYFAPRALVDALLPLGTTPPAREMHRVFLVRVVDATSIPEPQASLTSSGYGGYPGLGGAPSITAVVQLGAAVQVQGGLPPAAIRRVVRRNISQVQHCYEQGLQRNPNLAGNVTVAFVITPSGTVGGSSVVSNSLGDDAVGSCIAGAVRRWAFPEPSPPGPVAVRFPIDLSPRSR